MDGCLEGGLWNLSILLVVLFFCYFAGELTGLVHPTCSTPQKYQSDLLYLVLSDTCCLFSIKQHLLGGRQGGAASFHLLTLLDIDYGCTSERVN